MLLNGTNANLSQQLFKLAHENELLKAQIEQLKALACTDKLTGLDNRMSFDIKLDSLWELAGRNIAPIALILIDLDYFKEANDTFGHAFGDEVLKTVAQCLRKRCRRSDVVSRWGGDEFAVIMSSAETESAQILANDILSLIKEQGYSASIGVCSVIPSSPFVKGAKNQQEFLNLADTALYAAKRAGRGQVVAI